MSASMSPTDDILGVMTALVTPFKGGAGAAHATIIDEQALGDLCQAQIQAGVGGLVPCGTTGEAPTLSFAEHERVIRVVVEAAAGRVPVIAGVGSNSTAHSIELAEQARRAGARALLAVTPYYNKPTQEGLYRHYKALADVGLPLVLYNVPGRTGVDLLPDTIARLCDIPQIVGLKEATGTVQRVQQLISKLGDRISIFSGEDAINYPLYCVGARGCISVVSNIAPELTVQIWEKYLKGDHQLAAQLHYRFLPLAEILFIESNPIPVKTALSLMGRIGPELRPPLYAMSGPARERLRAVIAEHGLS